MKRKFTLFLLSLFALSLFAADPVVIKEGNKIMGHVVEDGNEDNIAYAAVLIVETGAGTTSNEDGQFAFVNLAPGKYTLRVSAMGYATMTKEVVERELEKQPEVIDRYGMKAYKFDEKPKYVEKSHTITTEEGYVPLRRHRYGIFE